MEPVANPRLAKQTAGHTLGHPKKPRKISAAELAFAETFVETGDSKAAMAVARQMGDPDPATISKRTPVRRLLEAAFERNGITLDHVVKAHKKQLKVRRALVVEGKVKYVTDGATRQKAIKDFYEIFGALDAPPEKAAHGTIVLHLRPEDRIMIERLRGEALPAGIIIDLPPEQEATP